MKKFFLFGIALLAMHSANAQSKEVLYSYPFETAIDHQYPATSTASTYGTQNNLLELNGVGNATTTIYAYTDGTYKIAAWCGVEGYDLDFSLAEDGTITVLNENAEYKASKGYWKVPTGLETYDRIQVFARKENGNNTYRSEISVSETQATVALRYNSYVWEKGNTGNASVMAAYYGRGFAGTPTKYSITECEWSDEAYDYVETFTLNTQQTTTVDLYTLSDNQYVAKDWLGENTGDLYFTVTDNDSIIVNDIANLSADAGFYYFYDINLAGDGIKPTWGSKYNSNSYGIGLWYGTEAETASSYVYRYVFIEPLSIDRISGISNKATDNAIYNLNGIRMNSENLPKGIYLINGKKVSK